MGCATQVQTPVALVDRNLDRRSSKMREPTRAAAEAFVQYLFSPDAQAEFAESGFRCRPCRCLVACAQCACLPQKCI